MGGYQPASLLEQRGGPGIPGWLAMHSRNIFPSREDQERHCPVSGAARSSGPRSHGSVHERRTWCGQSGGKPRKRARKLQDPGQVLSRETRGKPLPSLYPSRVQWQRNALSREASRWTRQMSLPSLSLWCRTTARRILRFCSLHERNGWMTCSLRPFQCWPILPRSSRCSWHQCSRLRPLSDSSVADAVPSSRGHGDEELRKRGRRAPRARRFLFRTGRGSRQAKVPIYQKCAVLSHLPPCARGGARMISTVSVASDTIWWSACVVALALRPATPSRHRRARLRALATRRVGKIRTRWPRHRWSRRVAPYTPVRVGEASHPGPLFTKHLPCPHCSTWLSQSGSLREHIKRFHMYPPSLTPPPPHASVLSEPSFTEADAVDEGRRRRQRGLRSQEARQGRSGHGEPRTIGHEEFTTLHSNVRGFISRVAELSARLRLMERKLSVLCLTEAWADKGLPTMRMEGYTLYPGMTVHTADWEAEWLCSLWSGLATGSPSSRIPRSQSAVAVHGPYVIGCWYRPPAPGEVDTIPSFKKKGQLHAANAVCCVVLGD